MGHQQNHILHVEAQNALFEGQVEGLIVTIYQNERPPAGLLGKLDWYFHGAVSQCIKHGAITGHLGECTYFPLPHHEATLHIILIGAGQTAHPGKRIPLPSEALGRLQQNLISLNLPKLGISQSDFGLSSPQAFSQYLGGIPLWITL